ncbi:hypothetical protein [Saccharopolyspora sp. NPDC002376]
METFECDVKRWPGGSSDLLAGVQRGKLALALVHLPVHAEGIEVFEVMREPLGAVLPATEFGSRTSVSRAGQPHLRQPGRADAAQLLRRGGGAAAGRRDPPPDGGEHR